MQNSVLFSLKALRRLEDERVEAEADVRRARAEMERQAKAEAEQRTRDEQTRRVREEEERRQRAEGDRESRQREGRFQVAESERRARVEAELALRKQQLLEEQRQRHAQGRRFGGPAWIAAAAMATAFVAIGGGLAAWASRQHQAERNALEGQIARRGAQARAAQLAFDAQIRALEDLADRHAGEVKPANDQARIAGDLHHQKRPSRRAAPPMPPTATPPKPLFRVPQKPEIDDEPLGGLPAVKSGGF